MFGNPDPSERIRKRTELLHLHAESDRTVEKLERDSEEQRRIAEAVRNTVHALRGGAE